MRLDRKPRSYSAVVGILLLRKEMRKERRVCTAHHLEVGGHSPPYKDFLKALSIKNIPFFKYFFDKEILYGKSLFNFFLSINKR